MSDTLDLAPPQRAPVLRANPSGRSVGDGAEQSWAFFPIPFEDGAEQSFPGMMLIPFEDGAEQSFTGLPGLPFEDGAAQSMGFVVYGSPYPFEDGAEQSFPGNAPPIFAFEGGAEQ
jgi:hypothetical protein